MLSVGGLETELIGEVITEEYRQAATERQVLHQPAYGTALVGAHRDELDHMVAGLQTVAGAATCMALGEGAYVAGGMRRAAPVQGQASALFLHQHARMAVGEAHGLLVQGMQPFGGVIVLFFTQHAPVLATKFVAVQPGGGQLQGGEQLVQLFQWATTDEGDSAFEAITDTADGFTHIRQELHGIRARSEFYEGAIDIEKQRTGVVQQWRWRTQGERFSHARQLASGGV